MRLAFQILNNVQSVNSYISVWQYTIQTGNPSNLYFQLVDMDQPGYQDNGLAGAFFYGGLPNSGNYLRFMPVASPTPSLTVQFTSLDLNRNLSKVAVQPFPQDTSIWMVQILPTDTITANGMTATLVMGGQTYNLQSVTELVSTPNSPYFC